MNMGAPIMFVNALIFLFIAGYFALAMHAINEVKNEVKAVKEILIQKEKISNDAGGL